MNGKQKQAQRVKNNVRPSNSGRSAVFLDTTATISPFRFVGSPFPLTSIDDIDSSIDSEFQLVLKKMNKKDSTTKLKALQEFTKLVKNAASDTVKAILPIWARLYCELATDIEHRVRVATHLAHNEVVLKVKRNLAPYLKQLAGPWFTSQYDTYAPASSAANRSFKDAFPVNKVQEALMFCQEEILNYICDNITVHTAQILTNKSINYKYKVNFVRILISSLQGYALYLQKVSEEGIRKVEELNKKILSHTEFWKLGRNKESQVRSSFFGVLTAVCEKAAFLLVGEEVNIVKAVFDILDEADPIVQTTLWDAILLTTKTIENWWTFCDIENKLFPKLWKVLQEAGNATKIYPNMLPLISHLPPSLNYDEFLPKFFNNIKTGLTQSSVKSSQSECRVISAAFMECLQYTIKVNHENTTLCEGLIKEHLISLIDMILVDSQASHKSFFNQVASLVQYWHKNKDAEQPTYAKYLQMFWQELEKLLSIRITEYAIKEEAFIVSELASRQILLLVCLKHSVKSKQFKVQFTTKGNKDDRKSCDRRDSKTQINVDRSYSDALQHLVFESCVRYIKIVNFDKAKKLPDIIENVLSLAQEFESECFIKHLKAQFCGGEDANLTELINLIFNWINDELLCRKSVVDLIFLLMKYATQEETHDILQKFLVVDNNEVFSWAISRTLSYPHNEDKVVQSWLEDEKVGNFLVKITEFVVADKSTPDFSLLLKQGFTETKNGGELFITKIAIRKILAILCNCMRHPTDNTLTIDNCASLASYIASTVYNDSTLVDDELFMALFHLSAHMNEEEYEFLSKDTLWEVKTAWQDTLAVLSANSDKDILKSLSEKCANIIEGLLLYNTDTSVELGHSIEIITKYLSVIEKGKPLFVSEIFFTFLDRDVVALWRKKLHNLVHHVEYFKGNICLQKQTNIGDDNIESKNILKYFAWKLLYMNVLHMETSNNNDYDNEQVNTNDSASTNRFIKLMDNPGKILVELLQDLVVFESVTQHFTHLNHFSNLQQLQKPFTSKFSELFTLEHSMKSSLESYLKRQLSSSEVNICVAAYKYFCQINNRSASSVYTTLIKDVSDEKRMHLTQVFSRNKEITFDHTIYQVSAIEAIVRLRCLVYCKEIDVQIAEVFGRIEKIKFLFSLGNWEETQTMIEIVRLCTEMLKSNRESNFSKRYWDFIVVNLATWSAKLSEAMSIYTKPLVSSFIIAVLNLYIAVSNHIDYLRVETPSSKCIDEWENVFVRSITIDLTRTWLYLSTKLTPEKQPTAMQPFLQDFGAVIGYLRPKFLFDARIEGMPKWSKLLKQCCALLTSPEHVLQLWGYYMLKVLSTGLIQVDAIAVDTNTPHEKGLIFEQFKDLLVEIHIIVSAMLIDLKLGEDCCRVEPFTDSYTYTFAYLLLWDILLLLCEKSSTELRYQYADWLKKEELLSSLLSSIFKLLPYNDFLYIFEHKSGSWFRQKSTLSFNDPITSEIIERLACSVYTTTLVQLPANVRQWWSSADRNTSVKVDRVTAVYISPMLCEQELTDVGNHENKFKNLTVKVYPSRGEVVATYTVDEAQMELEISLPYNYPLEGPDVTLNRQIGGLPHKQWLLQLKMCLLHQNGRIWDALSMWNNNLDNKFDGVEECYICFSVLHPGTYQLPKLSCKTCRKKFHAACLYKWFSTSNKSTCPICRNLF